MLSLHFESKARAARVAKRLLCLGVPVNLVADEVDLTKAELDVITTQLGDKAPRRQKGLTVHLPEQFVKESVRRDIVSTVLISVFLNLKANRPDLNFAELFAPSWDALVQALEPHVPGRFDMDARQAWSLLRFVEDGTLKIAKCYGCNTMFPKVGRETKCILCYQISFTHCHGCQLPLERNHRLHDRKWRVAGNAGLAGMCSKCRKREESGGSKSGMFSRLANVMT